MSVAIPREALRALPLLQRSFGGSLLALYLYGSAVTAGLRQNSDVDLMAIVNEPIAPETVAQLAKGLLDISGRYPPQPDAPRPLELIVFQQAELNPMAYPVRGEFVYGEWLRREFEAGAVPPPEHNPDFTLLLAQARAEARPLLGPALAELLPSISHAEVCRAIGDALPGLMAGLKGDERNVLLTLARMWRTLATGEFVPKDVAAKWAAPQLPLQVAALVSLAGNAYLGTTQDDWQPLEQEAQLAAADLGTRITALL
ncbi:hypothetical protein VW23_007055 [Devosia insulae DS-56]|uniref:Aminoglycoside (3'') (9) adenylyltransferase n=1 Tax=Devosia insulae DS-56 TaxID=1116389 RepID=A0A1E5XH87_9HYPH|nr:aminoglycoside adenylyltransferase domain-containing protein [Devosia insulae]OEO27955.1 hypothetical protein VW23_007055 [Devosia insulae DS-56]